MYGMEITFKARYINKAPIRVNAGNVYKDASFVKLDIRSNNDMSIINRVANSYQRALNNNPNEYNYADKLRDTFNKLFNNPSKQNNENFYALTVENVNKDGDIKSMDTDKILGVAQVNDNPEGKDCELKYFQVHPATKYKALNRKYSGIGEAIWDSILGIFQKDIVATYDIKALGFYLKHGCEGLSMDKVIYRHEGNKLNCEV